MYNQDSLPTPEQLTQAMELAPPELQEAASVAGPPLIAAGDDMVAFFVAYAQDDVEQAIDQLNAYEDETLRHGPRRQHATRGRLA